MAEALIEVDLASPVPAYRQVVDQLRLHLNAGTLTPGDQLPSVRRLAAQLGVHFNTIAEAYRELAEEGWIDLSHGRRAVVRPLGSGLPIARAEQKLLRQRLRQLVAEMQLKGISARAIERDVTGILQG